jgi:hypothetical protein
VTTERDKGRGIHTRDERGAALVEFALIFPIFMVVVLGMFSGAREYNRKNAMISAARETSRYGATLPVASAAPSGTVSNWLHQLAVYAEKTSEGSLAPTVGSREICVAYVYDPDTGADQTVRETHFSGNVSSGVVSGSKCFEDGRPATEARVQVSTRRTGKIDGLFFTIPLTLTSRTVTRFEAPT